MSFASEDARRIGERLGIDWAASAFDVEEYRVGLGVELEHGRRDPETDVTGDDELATGKIALAHLREFPDYYTRLERMEEEARRYWAQRSGSSQERRLVHARSTRADEVGYSRAVAVGNHVFVAGTAPVSLGGRSPLADPYQQAKRCLEIIVAALAEVGAAPADVVRTRIYLADPDDIDEVGRAHGEIFGDVRPVTTAIAVAFPNPSWLVQIEAEAVIA
jgi:enamine deaminase RidA (YjgF/YER057c/UK114 family)